MPLVYTNPASTRAPWPHIVSNPFSVEHAIRYLERYGGQVESILYDAGVHTVFYGNTRLDYPEWFVGKYISGLLRIETARRAYARQAELLYVIPDVPADYPGREHLYPANVEKTVELILYFEERHIPSLPGTPVAVVQGGFNRPESVIETWRTYRSVYRRYEIVALGNVCSSRRINLIARELLLFDRHVDRPYHAFGVHSRALSFLASRGYRLCRIRSIDSSSYYWDYHYRFGQGKTGEDKARIMLWRLERLREKLERATC